MYVCPECVLFNFYSCGMGNGNVGLEWGNISRFPGSWEGDGVETRPGTDRWLCVGTVHPKGSLPPFLEPGKKAMHMVAIDSYIPS